MNRTQTDIQTALNERHQNLLINDPSILMICWLKMTVCKPVLHSSLMILFISTWTRTQTNSTWQNHCGGGNRPVGIRGMFPIGNSFLRNCTQIRPTHAECFISKTSREPKYGGFYQEKLMTRAVDTLRRQGEKRHCLFSRRLYKKHFILKCS